MPTSYKLWLDTIPMVDRNRPAEPFDPFPSSALTPSDVVRLQLDALQNDDLLPENLGVRIAYRFASPGNKAAVGSHQDFLRLIKGNPAYHPMIGFERAELGTLAYSIFGDQVRQRVWLHRRGHITAIYCYVLSKQSDAPLKGCWIVDAVIREA